MSLTELADAWEVKANELMGYSRAYKSKCNEGLKNGYVGRYHGLMTAAAELRAWVEANADPAE